MFKPSRILIPTDLSVHSDKAIRQAFDIARQFGSEVYLLHVIRDPVSQCTVDFCLENALFEKLQAMMYEFARSEVREQLAKFPYIDPKSVTTDIKIGVPYDQILQESKEREIDLIVMGSQGASGLKNYFLGSVARHVLQGAECPVLLVR